MAELEENKQVMGAAVMEAVEETGKSAGSQFVQWSGTEH